VSGGADDNIQNRKSLTRKSPGRKDAKFLENRKEEKINRDNRIKWITTVKLNFKNKRRTVFRLCVSQV